MATLAPAGTAVYSNITPTPGSAGSLTATLPSGIAVGECLLMNVASGSSGTPVTITTPTGWTLLNKNTTGAGGYLFYKIAVAADTSATSVAVPYSAGATGQTYFVEAGIIRLTGVDGTTPVDVAASTGSTGYTLAAGAVSETVPSITTVTAGASQIVMSLVDDTAASSPVGTPPSGFTRLMLGPQRAWQVGYRTIATAGAAGSSVWTATSGWSGNEMAYVQTALRPSTAAAPLVATPNLLTSTPAVLAPVVASTVTTTPNLLASTPSLFAPTVVASSAAVPAFLSSTPQLFAPVLQSTVTVSPALLASAPVVFAPVAGSISYVSPALLVSAPQLLAPSAVYGTVRITPDLLVSTPVILAPKLGGLVVVAPDAVASIPQVFAPWVTPTGPVAPVFLQRTPQLFAPRGPKAPVTWFYDHERGNWYPAAVTYYDKAQRRWTRADVEITGAPVG